MLGDSAASWGIKIKMQALIDFSSSRSSLGNMSEKEPNIRKLRRNAFYKREHIMRKGITEALGMLMGIPDTDGKIGQVGAHLADVLIKEASVVIPDPRPEGKR